MIVAAEIEIQVFQPDHGHDVTPTGIDPRFKYRPALQPGTDGEEIGSFQSPIPCTTNRSSCVTF